jgi:uncharacterized membrane protein (GlpM family)
MVVDLALRFVAGGIVVSLFAFLGEVVKPKSFAGLFAAAPSVAIATLGLTALRQPRTELQISGRSMCLGAVALVVCTVTCAVLLRRTKLPVRAATLAGWLVWGAAAAALACLVLRGGA